MTPIIGIITTVCIGLLVTVVVVAIYNKVDTSPTQDPECRGGHDF